MNGNTVKRFAMVGILMLGASLAVPAMAQMHGHGGGGYRVGVAHAGGRGYGGGWHGGGWYGGGPYWWGPGLGLGLGLGIAYAAAPYAYYPYYGYDVPYAVPAAPAAPVAATPSGAAGTWYYCEPARSYYPYVTQCPQPWREVPATPPAPPR